jgi:hypothetical protein
MNMAMKQPLVVLPAQEREGAFAFVRGMSMESDAAPLGFAFCPYRVGTVHHDNWLSGYARYAFDE